MRFHVDAASICTGADITKAVPLQGPFSGDRNAPEGDGLLTEETNLQSEYGIGDCPFGDLAGAYTVGGEVLPSSAVAVEPCAEGTLHPGEGQVYYRCVSE